MEQTKITDTHWDSYYYLVYLDFNTKDTKENFILQCQFTERSIFLAS
jgi:hypothetical protein